MCVFVRVAIGRQMPWQWHQMRLTNHGLDNFRKNHDTSLYRISNQPYNRHKLISGYSNKVRHLTFFMLSLSSGMTTTIRLPSICCCTTHSFFHPWQQHILFNQTQQQPNLICLKLLKIATLEVNQLVTWYVLHYQCVMI